MSVSSGHGDYERRRIKTDNDLKRSPLTEINFFDFLKYLKDEELLLVYDTDGRLLWAGHQYYIFDVVEDGLPADKETAWLIRNSRDMMLMAVYTDPVNSEYLCIDVDWLGVRKMNYPILYNFLRCLIHGSQLINIKKDGVLLWDGPVVALTDSRIGNYERNPETRKMANDSLGLRVLSICTEENEPDHICIEVVEAGDWD